MLISSMFNNRPSRERKPITIVGTLQLISHVYLSVGLIKDKL